MRLHCGFIKSEYLDVGSGKYLSAANQPAIILIFKKSWCIIRLYVVFVLRAFMIERFWIVWCDWLFRLVVFCWTVVILWERRKIMDWRCIAMLPLLNPMLKWVHSDPCGWTFDLGVYCLLWKRFLVLNVALRMTQAQIVWRTATDTFCVEENAVGCSALF